MFFGLLFLVSFSLASFQPEPKDHATNGWQKGGRTLSKTRLDVLLALSRPFSLTNELYDISNPKLHQRYGKHWTLEQVVGHVRPDKNTLRAVQRFARKHRLNCNLLAGHSDWMQCRQVPVSTLEKLFSAEFYDFTHAKASGAVLPRTASYVLPAELIGHVDFVAGMKRLPDMRQVGRPIHAARQSSGVTPQRSRELWKIPTSVQGNPSNGIDGIFQFFNHPFFFFFLTPLCGIQAIFKRLPSFWDNS
jgi:hypothetical protein